MLISNYDVIESCCCFLNKSTTVNKFMLSIYNSELSFSLLLYINSFYRIYTLLHLTSLIIDGCRMYELGKTSAEAFTWYIIIVYTYLNTHVFQSMYMGDGQDFHTTCRYKILHKKGFMYNL